VSTINGVLGPCGLGVLHETKSPLLTAFFLLPFSPSVTSNKNVRIPIK
jgi:hypothetical protein